MIADYLKIYDIFNNVKVTITTLIDKVGKD